MAGIKNAPKPLNSEYKNTGKVSKPKYLVKVIQKTGLDKEANKSKYESADKNVYNKKSLSPPG